MHAEHTDADSVLMLSASFFVSQLKINPLLCRGREDLQIKVKTRARIKVGLQTTNKLTREVCQMGTENSPYKMGMQVSHSICA